MVVIIFLPCACSKSIVSISNLFFVSKMFLFFLIISSTCGSKVNSQSQNYIVPPKGEINIFHISNDLDTSDVVFKISTQASAFKLGLRIHNEIKGYIVDSNSSNGCQKNYPPVLSDDKYKLHDDNILGWILIVNNLGCSYKTKVENAHETGFIAVIIYNHKLNETEVIGIDGKNLIELPIPAYSVGFYDGIQLKNLYNYDLRFYVSIVTPASMYHIIMLVVIWTGLGGIIFVFIISLFKSCRYPWIIIPSCIRRSEIAMKKIELKRSMSKYLILKWKPELRDRFEICVFCMEDYIKGDRICILNCYHGFHKICIESWMLQANHFCPLCKQKFNYATSCYRKQGEIHVAVEMMERNAFTDLIPGNSHPTQPDHLPG